MCHAVFLFSPAVSCGFQAYRQAAGSGWSGSQTVQLLGGSTYSAFWRLNWSRERAAEQVAAGMRSADREAATLRENRQTDSTATRRRRPDRPLSETAQVVASRCVRCVSWRRLDWMMMSSCCWTWLNVSVTVFCFLVVDAHLNLFMNETETRRLLGELVASIRLLIGFVVGVVENSKPPIRQCTLLWRGLYVWRNEMPFEINRASTHFV